LRASISPALSFGRTTGAASLSAGFVTNGMLALRSTPITILAASITSRIGIDFVRNASIPLVTKPADRDAAPVVRPKLSAGEMEALKLYVAGNSTDEVAAQLNVRYETAKTYLRRVREKYAKVNRPAGKKADLIRRAAEDGYLH
jgi:DNA-binding CsgD family transcriptional regulator